MFVDAGPYCVTSTSVNTILEVTSTTPATVPCCTPLSGGPLDTTQAEDMAAILKALADPVRLQIVSIVACQPSGEICACDLPEVLGRAQPTISHHLTKLVQAGLLEREQRGKWAWFRLADGRITELADALRPTVAAQTGCC